MRTKDWKAKDVARVLVVGEDSNLQWSETVEKYAMFADYYFRAFPEDHGERSSNVEARNLFSYIKTLTGNKMSPNEINTFLKLVGKGMNKMLSFLSFVIAGLIGSHESV